MPRGALPKIREFPPEVLDPYLAGMIGYREVARRLGQPRNTVLRALRRYGYTAGRQEVDRQGRLSRERWKPVDVAPYERDYEVSSLGRVSRATGGFGAIPGRILKPAIAKDGHPKVALSRDSKVKVVTIAPLVARAFLPPPPSPHHVVGHKNGSLSDCRAANLYWKTRGDVQRERRGRCKFTPEEADAIRALKGTRSAYSLARELGVHRMTIDNLWNDKTPAYAVLAGE